jgi:protein-tyrosine phosphatase
MIDLHCHILPGLDDGPEKLDESVAMCQIAFEDGIRTIVATPHFRPGAYEFRDPTEQLTALRREVERLGLELTILPGADVTVTPELPLHLVQQPMLTINGMGKYVLAELPHEAVPARWDDFLLSLRKRGTTPIITHPERNRWFLNHSDALYPFVLAGGLVQITAMSILGENGPESREYSTDLLKRGLVHVIASDAHSSDQRQPRLAAAVLAAGEIIGRDRALRMVRENPGHIVTGVPVEAEHKAPEEPRKRKWYHRMLDL